MKLSRLSIWLIAIQFLSPTCTFTQWIATEGPGYLIRFLHVRNGIIFAATFEDGVFSSSDAGANWTPVNAGLTSNALFVQGIASNSEFLFLATQEGIYRSSNNGVHWDSVNVGLPHRYVQSVAASSQRVFVGVFSYGAYSIYSSTDNGSTWNSANNGIPAMRTAESFYLGNQYILAGIAGEVYKSTDNGKTWTNPSPTFNGTISSFAGGSFGVFGGTSGGVFRSTDDGLTWVSVNSGLLYQGYTYSNMPLVIGDKVFVGVYTAFGTSGVFRSNDYGAHWDTLNYQLTNPKVRCIAADALNLYVGIGSFMFYRSLASVLTSANDIHSFRPQEFSLKQNYPNPFNPSTTIEFTLVEKQATSLRIYDLLGNAIATLLDNDLSPGVYSLVWKPKNLPSGSYFYRLQTEAYSQIRKMTIVK